MALLETDPIDWELDRDGDLIIPLRRTFGIKGVAQRIRIRTRIIMEEWFANLDIGIRYLASADKNGRIPERDALLGQPWDPVKFLGEFRRVISTVPGVIGIPVCVASFDPSTRIARARWRVTTAFGDTPDDSLDVKI